MSNTHFIRVAASAPDRACKLVESHLNRIEAALFDYFTVMGAISQDNELYHIEGEYEEKTLEIINKEMDKFIENIDSDTNIYKEAFRKVSNGSNDYQDWSMAGKYCIEKANKAIIYKPFNCLEDTFNEDSFTEYGLTSIDEDEEYYYIVLVDFHC